MIHEGFVVSENFPSGITYESNIPSTIHDSLPRCVLHLRVWVDLEVRESVQLYYRIKSFE